MTYTYTDNTNTWIRFDDGNGNIKQIPCDPLNTDYAEILANGVTINPYVAPPATVPAINKLQALLWLATKGKSNDDVVALINTITDPQQQLQAKAYWEASLSYHYDNTFIQMLWAGLGITETTAQAFTEAALLG